MQVNDELRIQPVSELIHDYIQSKKRIWGALNINPIKLLIGNDFIITQRDFVVKKVKCIKCGEYFEHVTPFKTGKEKKVCPRCKYLKHIKLNLRKRIGYCIRCGKSYLIESESQMKRKYCSRECSQKRNIINA